MNRGNRKKKQLRPGVTPRQEAPAEEETCGPECVNAVMDLLKDGGGYRSLFEAANDAMFLLRRNIYVECNTKALELFKCSKEKIIGQSFYAFAPETQPNGKLSREKCPEKISSSEQFPLFFEWRHRRYDGSTFDSEVSVSKIKLSGTSFILAIVRDITERKRAEEMLHKSFLEIKRLKRRLEAENTYLQGEIKLVCNRYEIVGQSKVFRSVLKQVDQVARTNSTVLFLGETGTGKELLARAVHDLSSRKKRPMVKVNCAALPTTLLESELFGHERGAYTGALSSQLGRFEVADGSTIFLDEISELQLDLQAKLLRVLQEGQFERLGSTRTIQADVRVIAASNQDLSKAVQEGRFRPDLYYRLNVFPIVVPPLRDRREDIPQLTWAFAADFGQTMGKRFHTIPKKSMEAMQHYPWPGNIRELRNVIERAAILSKDSTLHITLPETAVSGLHAHMKLQEVEKKYIQEVLRSTGWRIRGKGGAAEISGLKPTTLEARIKKLDMKRPKEISNIL